MTRPAWMTTGSVPGAGGGGSGEGQRYEDPERRRSRSRSYERPQRSSSRDRRRSRSRSGGRGAEGDRAARSSSRSDYSAPPAAAAGYAPLGSYGGVGLGAPVAAASLGARLGGGGGSAGGFDTSALIAAALANAAGAGAAAAGGGFGGLGGLGGGGLGGGAPSTATRPFRRLFLGNLTQPTHDAELANYVNELLSRGYAPGQHVVSAQVHAGKGFGFVELRTVELATACLQLDGVPFKGVPLRPRRPKDYNEALAPRPAVRGWARRAP
jgi:splicing factor U2AF subunit